MSSILENLTVVIVTWNTPEFAAQSARALISDGVLPNRIVVVDNGSTEENARQVQADLPSCRVLRIDENVGFARASNAGARALKGDHYLFVNDDAFVHRPRSVAALVSVLADASVGVVVPRLLNPDLTLQPNVVPLNSPRVAFLRASGLSRFVPNRWQPRWSTHWRHEQSRSIDAAIGAVLLVRGELWHELGGFKEGVSMYAEDLDLYWRVKRLGWQVRFAAEAEFVHVGNVASGVWSDPRRAELKSRAEALVIRTHLSLPAALATIAFICVGLFVRAVVFSLTGKRSAAASALAAVRGYATGTRTADSGDA